MRLDVEAQRAAISDETRARIAMARPILRSTLFALASDRVERLGGFASVTLHDLAREYREGDGDCGICFEYAIHEAIERMDALLMPRVAEVLSEFCNILGTPRSILFGAEKGKRLELVSTDAGLLTDESRLLVGRKGNPPKLKRYLAGARRAFASPEARKALPASIRGLWRADLFVGTQAQDRWVATTLKTNAADLEGGAGIRIGIFPERRKHEAPSLDRDRNLVLCPVPYDGGFMDLFYGTFFLVKAFLASDARLPRPVDLPLSMDRHVAKVLEERRSFAVLDVVEALEKLAQPGLLESSSAGDQYSNSTVTAIAPVALSTR